jgi:hypothetical protein
MAGFEFIRRHDAHSTDDCTFELDEYQDASGHQMLLAHLRVHKWSLSSHRRIQHDWAVFRSVVTTPLFATPMPYEGAELERWRRFVELMGWRPFSHVTCEDGHVRPLYRHDIRRKDNQEQREGP